MTFALYILLFAIEYLGLGYDFPIIRTLKVSLLLSFGLAARLAMMGEPGRIFRYRQSRLLLAFVGMTLASVSWALVKSHAFASFEHQLGYSILAFSGFMLMTDPSRVRWFVYALVGFHVLLVLQNLEKLASSARVGVFDAGYFLGDGNDFGWSLNVALPFALFAAFTDKRWLLRVVGYVSAGLLAFGIVGTQSRGATLALAASGLWFILNSRRKVLGLAVIVAAIVAVFLFAPAHYFERMETVQNYEEDGSAQGRLRAWKAATQMAFDYPLGIGAGNFNSVYGRYYRPDPGSQGWGSARWISVHSIYFAILAEYGFGGLGLWLFLLWTIFRDNLKGERMVPAPTSDADPLAGIGVFLNMSLIGYAVGGVFLGGVDYPHIFVLWFLSLGALSLREIQSVPPAAEAVKEAGLGAGLPRGGPRAVRVPDEQGRLPRKSR